MITPGFQTNLQWSFWQPPSQTCTHGLCHCLTFTADICLDGHIRESVQRQLFCSAGSFPLSQVLSMWTGFSKFHNSCSPAATEIKAECLLTGGKQNNQVLLLPFHIHQRAPARSPGDSVQNMNNQQGKLGTQHCIVLNWQKKDPYLLNHFLALPPTCQDFKNKKWKCKVWACSSTSVISASWLSLWLPSSIMQDF